MEKIQRYLTTPTRHSENDKTPQPIDLIIYSPSPGPQVRNCNHSTVPHYLAHGHMGQMVKWSWHWKITDLDYSIELQMQKIHSVVLEICFCKFWTNLPHAHLPHTNTPPQPHLQCISLNVHMVVWFFVFSMCSVYSGFGRCIYLCSSRLFHRPWDILAIIWLFQCQWSNPEGYG